MAAPSARATRYNQILETIFLGHYQPGGREVPFRREELIQAAAQLGLPPTSNVGDVVYSSRYRGGLPAAVQATAPPGEQWIILPAGRAQYRFVLVAQALAIIMPNALLTETKVPDATPGLITRYASGDEQALLATVRYNRLIDIFTGLTCNSLQSHLRTTVPDMGQVETDELYVGLDRRGAHYAIPVQAKGGSDKLSIVQIAQDMALCSAKYPDLICKPIAAQFMTGGGIALFLFEPTAANVIGLGIAHERHYRLVPPAELTRDELRLYRERADT